MDWLAFATEITRSVTLNFDVAVSTIMTDLMNAIHEIMSDDKSVERKSADRTWTLHRIRGEEILCDSSEESMEIRKVYHHISEGLIGLTIEQGRDFNVFGKACEHPRYCPGWIRCKSELIALIKQDEDRKPIGVVNIESDVFFDFYTAKEHDQEQYKEKKKNLEKVLNIATNHLSIVFKSKKLSENNQFGNNIFSNFSKGILTERDLKNAIRKAINFVAERTPVLMLGVYLTDNISSNISNYHVSELAKGEHSDQKYTERYYLFADFMRETYFQKNIQNYNPIKLPKEIDVSRSIEKYNRTPSFFSQGDDIISDSFFNDFEPAKTNSYKFLRLQWSNLSPKNCDFISNIIVLSIIEDKSTIQNKALIDFFDFVSFCLKSFIEQKSLRSRVKINKAISSINSINYESANAHEIRDTEDRIANLVTDITESQLCFVYLSCSSYQFNSEQMFYLAGTSESQANFADVLVSPEGRIGEVITENIIIYHDPDYLGNKDKKPTLGRGLENYDLQKPELFILPLYVQTANEATGALVLIRDTSDAKKTDKFEIMNLLINLGPSISNSIELKLLQLIRGSAFYTYNSMFSIFPDVFNAQYTEEEIFFRIQEYVNSIINSTLQPISCPCCFAVFRLNSHDDRFQLITEEGLLKNDIGHDSPEFQVGTGLTGSVINTRNGELFVPFVDKNGKPKELNAVSPHQRCIIYWNKMIGSSERFFYGKHVKVGLENYILVVIGKRTKGFSPSLASQLLNGLISSMSQQFKVILYNRVTTCQEENNVTTEDIKKDFGLIKKFIKRDSEYSSTEEQKILEEMLDEVRGKVLLLNNQSNGLTIREYLSNTKNLLIDAAEIVEKTQKLSSAINYLISFFIGH